MSFEYIREAYKVPAQTGRIVKFKDKDKKGVIVDSKGQYLLVVFDGMKATQKEVVHPTWNLEYLGIGKVPKITKAQRRYQEYLSFAECYNCSFIDFLKNKYYSE